MPSLFVFLERMVQVGERVVHMSKSFAQIDISPFCVCFFSFSFRLASQVRTNLHPQVYDTLLELYLRPENSQSSKLKGPFLNKRTKKGFSERMDVVMLIKMEQRLPVSHVLSVTLLSVPKATSEHGKVGCSNCCRAAKRNTTTTMRWF